MEVKERYENEESYTITLDAGGSCSDTSCSVGSGASLVPADSWLAMCDRTGQTVSHTHARLTPVTYITLTISSSTLTQCNR